MCSRHNCFACIILNSVGAGTCSTKVGFTLGASVEPALGRSSQWELCCVHIGRFSTGDPLCRSSAIGGRALDRKGGFVAFY